MHWGGQQIVTPQGDVLVVIPLAQFEMMSAAAAAAGALPWPPVGGDLPWGSSFAPALASAEPEGRGASVPAQVHGAIAAGDSPLAAWRKYRGISQSQLARIAGVSRFTVMRLEAAGAGAGNRQSRRALAEALGVPSAEI